MLWGLALFRVTQKWSNKFLSEKEKPMLHFTYQSIPIKKGLEFECLIVLHVGWANYFCDFNFSSVVSVNQNQSMVWVWVKVHLFCSIDQARYRTCKTFYVSSNGIIFFDVHMCVPELVFLGQISSVWVMTHSHTLQEEHWSW